MRDLKDQENLFTQWLALWRAGIADDPDISVLVMDFHRDTSGFYQKLETKANSFHGIGLISGTPRGYQMDLHSVSCNWIGPDAVVRRLEQFIKTEVGNIKKRMACERLEDALEFRYWIISGGERVTNEWSAYWAKFQ